MDLLAPLGPVYQAGTLSGNPLAMAAGIATLTYLQDHAAEVYPQLEATAKAVAEGVAAEAAQAGVPLTLNRVGSMWTWFFTPGPVTNYAQAAQSDTAAFGRFHRAMLDAGIWLPPSQFEAAFLSTAHGAARNSRHHRRRAPSLQRHLSRKPNWIVRLGARLAFETRERVSPSQLLSPRIQRHKPMRLLDSARRSAPQPLPTGPR